MSDKKRNPPRGPRGGGGGSRRGRDADKAASARSGKPPGAKEWRSKGGKEAPHGASRRKDDSASAAKERPAYSKPRGPRDERDATRPRPPRRDGESAGARRERPTSTQRDGERPPRRKEWSSESREGAFKRHRELADSSSRERSAYGKPRAPRAEGYSERPRPPRRDGENAEMRRDRPTSWQRDGERPPRHEESRSDARDGGFKRSRDFAAGGSGERSAVRKPRTQADERGAPARPRPPREGGESAGYRGDRAPRRAEGRDEGFARKRDFAARGTGERSSFPKRRTEDGDRPARNFGDRGPRKYPSPAKEGAFEGERIAKAMARAGACSRRDAEQWIAEGRVTVNGRKLSSPAFNVRESDRIEVDGKPLAERERTRLFLFHKPPGLVTSAKDPQGRDTVFDYIRGREPELPRLMSVGRLDINTQGLLLLSNDGGLARALELPATGWKRRYRVRAHGETDQAALDRLAQGVEIEGVDYAPIEAKIERQQGSNVWIAMTLSEGKNREVKRVLAHLGLEVTRLIRVSFGPFQLGELDEGSIEEVRLKVLREQLGKSLAEFAGVDFSSPLREEKTPAKQQQERAAAASRPRKHVSVLRREREAHEDEAAPRTRIERATTADRKGRAIAVERVVVKGQKPAASSRNARRFAAERRDAEASPRKGTKPPRRSPPRDPKKPR